MDISEFEVAEKDYDDFRFGVIDILYRRSDPSQTIFIKRKFSTSQEEFELAISNTAFRRNLSTPFLLKMLDFVQHDENMQIDAIFEYTPDDISSIYESIQPIPELFRFLENILEALSYLEMHKMVHGNLRPEYIYFKQTANHYVVQDRLGENLSPMESQLKMLNSNEPLFVPPNIFTEIFNQNSVYSHKPFKVETFALGVMVLTTYLGSERVQTIYNRETGEFDIVTFQGLAKFVSENFFSESEEAELIWSFIETALLEVEASGRPSPKGALTAMKEIKREIAIRGKLDLNATMSILNNSKLSAIYRESHKESTSMTNRTFENEHQSKLKDSEAPLILEEPVPEIIDSIEPTPVVEEPEAPKEEEGIEGDAQVSIVHEEIIEEQSHRESTHISEAKNENFEDEKTSVRISETPNEHIPDVIDIQEPEQPSVDGNVIRKSEAVSIEAPTPISNKKIETINDFETELEENKEKSVGFDIMNTGNDFQSLKNDNENRVDLTNPEKSEHEEKLLESIGLQAHLFEPIIEKTEVRQSNDPTPKASIGHPEAKDEFEGNYKTHDATPDQRTNEIDHNKYQSVTLNVADKIQTQLIKDPFNTEDKSNIQNYYTQAPIQTPTVTHMQNRSPSPMFKGTVTQKRIVSRSPNTPNSFFVDKIPRLPDHRKVVTEVPAKQDSNASPGNPTDQFYSIPHSSQYQSNIPDKQKGTPSYVFAQAPLGYQSVPYNFSTSPIKGVPQVKVLTNYPVVDRSKSPINYASNSQNIVGKEKGISPMGVLNSNYQSYTGPKTTQTEYQAHSTINKTDYVINTNERIVPNARFVNALYRPDPVPNVNPLKTETGRATQPKADGSEAVMKHDNKNLVLYKVENGKNIYRYEEDATK
jgi:hypothetical protein